jgi:hypothetical protein
MYVSFARHNHFDKKTNMSPRSTSKQVPFFFHPILYRFLSFSRHNYFLMIMATKIIHVTNNSSSHLHLSPLSCMVALVTIWTHISLVPPHFALPFQLPSTPPIFSAACLHVINVT